MESNELIQLWNSMDKKMDQHLEVNQKLLMATTFAKIRTQLSEYKCSSIFELGVNVLFAVFLTSFLSNFITDHITEWRFFLPGVLLLVLMFYGIFFNIRTLYRISVLNYCTPVVEAQKVGQQLRLEVIRERRLLYVIVPLFSVAFVIVLTKAIADVDMFEYSAFLWQLTGGSVIIAIAIVWFLKKFPDKGMQSALALLSEIYDFEQERSAK